MSVVVEIFLSGQGVLRGNRHARQRNIPALHHPVQPAAGYMAACLRCRILARPTRLGGSRSSAISAEARPLEPAAHPAMPTATRIPIATEFLRRCSPHFTLPRHRHARTQSDGRSPAARVYCGTAPLPFDACMTLMINAKR